MVGEDRVRSAQPPSDLHSRSIVRALVIEQDETESAALLGEVLDARGFSLESFVVQTDPRSPAGRGDYPDPRDYDLVVPMGSGWSVYDERIADWVQPQLRMLRCAVDADVAVFGVCFGAQALAAATGGSVQRAPFREVGWYEVASSTPVLGGLWFQWHQDSFTPGPGSRVLAASAAGPQAFSIGRSLGVQFHPEVTSAHLRRWFDDGGDTEMAAQGGDPVEAVRMARLLEDEMRVRVAAMLDWFLAGMV